MNAYSTTPNNFNKPENRLVSGLYIVATPIGNLRDITLRALDVLSQADIVLCEDTRVTGKLMAAYDLKTRLMSYHDHNSDKVRPLVLKKLDEGQIVALVSDAGTPLISDPGYKLVRDCAEQDKQVFPIPGASAVLSALSVAGLATDRFLFVGFLPPKSSARQTVLSELAPVASTLVFYEGNSRLLKSLKDMLSVLGDRSAVVARELTKKFEEVKRGKLSELVAYYQEKGSPKGEIVIVVDRDQRAVEEKFSDEDIDAFLGEALGQMGMSVRDASSYVAEKTGFKKRVLYARALALISKAPDA